MRSKTGKQTTATAIYTLSDISKIKGNHTMKFSQLIECNMKNIFFERSCTKCWRN